MPDVALLGLGPMGLPIARRLGDAGVATSIWNRTPGRTPPSSFLREVSHPADAAASIVLTVLPDLPQVEEVLAGAHGLLAGWALHEIESPILVVHGTVSPIDIVDFATTMRAEHGVIVIDAPMTGGTIGAEAGTLALLLGGAPDVLARLTPIFNVYSTRSARLGDVGAGSLGKACNQIIVAGTITAISEAMLLARRSGLDLDVLLELLQGGLAGSEILRQKGERWRANDFSNGGSAKNQLKDLSFARAAGQRSGVAMPVTDVVAELFEMMVNSGLGDLDHTGVYRTIEEASS